MFLNLLKIPCIYEFLLLLDAFDDSGDSGSQVSGIQKIDDTYSTNQGQIIIIQNIIILLFLNHSFTYFSCITIIIRDIYKSLLIYWKPRVSPINSYTFQT